MFYKGLNTRLIIIQIFWFFIKLITLKLEIFILRCLKFQDVVSIRFKQWIKKNTRTFHWSPWKPASLCPDGNEIDWLLDYLKFKIHSRKYKPFYLSSIRYEFPYYFMYFFILFYFWIWFGKHAEKLYSKYGWTNRLHRG